MAKSDQVSAGCSRHIRFGPSIAALAAALACATLLSSQTLAADITVMISGGFYSTYLELAPAFEQKSGDHLITIRGPSMGATAGAIPARLERGEEADVVILVRSTLDDLVAKGFVRAGTRTDLARSKIGLAVRIGAPEPDISMPSGVRNLNSARSTPLHIPRSRATAAAACARSRAAAVHATRPQPLRNRGACRKLRDVEYQRERVALGRFSPSGSYAARREPQRVQQDCYIHKQTSVADVVQVVFKIFVNQKYPVSADLP